MGAHTLCLASFIVLQESVPYVMLAAQEAVLDAKEEIYCVGA